MAGLVFATSGLFALLIGNIEIYGISLDAGGLLGTATARLLDAYLRLAGSLIILGSDPDRRADDPVRFFRRLLCGKIGGRGGKGRTNGEILA